MTEIKLNDRVKHKDGRTGTVIFDDDKGGLTLFVLWDDGSYGWLYRIDDGQIAEVIGKRYFVDTPFEVGKTYETNHGQCKETIEGVGLICFSSSGYRSYRYPNGKHSPHSTWNLVLPKSEPKPCEGREVDIDGVKYRLVKVENQD